MCIRYYLDLAIDHLCNFYHNSPAVKISSPSSKLLLESATSLARKIRNRELTSEEVVCAFIDRIHEVNPIINALVDQRFNEAIKEARDVDNGIAKGTITEDTFRTKPFLGVPFTVKEIIAAKGLSNTFGLISRRNEKANFDAKVVERMKNSGGILLGVTNVPQLSAWYETRNPIYGVTNNPFDIRRTAGGSSGGEASIIAACGSPIGVGSDLGGSVRHPAFMCGLFAHKPTSGVVSAHGLLFNLLDKENSMASVGPLTKHSEDLAPILKILAGDNAKKLKLDETVDINKLNFFYVLNPKDPFVSPIREEITYSILSVVNYLRKTTGKEPHLLDIDELKYGGRLWRYWITQEKNVSLKTDLTNRQGEINHITEVAKFCMKRSSFSLGITLALIAELLPKENSKWAEELTYFLSKKLSDILGTNGILLYPSAPKTCNYHNTTIFWPFNSNLFSIWNALKFCVTQVPLGLNSEGLPIGIQIVGAPFQDHLTIAVAKELEKGFGGFVAPFPVD